MPNEFWTHEPAPGLNDHWVCYACNQLIDGQHWLYQCTDDDGMVLWSARYHYRCHNGVERLVVPGNLPAQPDAPPAPPASGDLLHAFLNPPAQISLSPAEVAAFGHLE